MTDQSKGFERGVVRDVYGLDRLQVADRRIQVIKAQAAPPPGMGAAPVAPARGPQVIIQNWTVSPGGMRQRDGVHMRALSPLAQAVAQAQMRHEARHPDLDFVPPYGPGQVAMAEFYAALVEWRDGSAMKCASLEAGREGGGSGHFIDSYIDKGKALAELQARIGSGVAMDVRRHMDRGNARSRITVRAAVDMVCLGGLDVSEVLRRFGWAPKGEHRRQVRAAICGALDRMQGYRDQVVPKYGIDA